MTTTLPADKFDKTMTFVRPATVPQRVSLDSLAVLPGFNTRVKDEEYSARVASITQSIVANGFFDDKPFAVVMRDGDETVYIYDGEHRFDAAKAAVLDGAEFAEGLPVAFAKDGATVKDLTVHLARGNEGEKLNMVESAAVVRRLLDMGSDKAEIAVLLDKTPRHVENLITLGGANATVKKAVAEGKIAGAEAVKLVRKHGSKEAGEKITTLVKQAEEKGKAKSTPKTASTGPKMKRVEATISLAAGTTLASLLAAVSSNLQSTLKFDDDEALIEDGKLVLQMHVIDHEGIAAAADAQAEREAKAARREIERAEAAKVRDAERVERQKVKDAAAAAKAKETAKPKAPAKPKTETKPKAEAKTPEAAKPRRRAGKPAEAAKPDDGMGGL